MARQEITQGTTKQFLTKINENFLEIYQKLEICQKLEDLPLPTIYSGTENPDPDLGTLGDIYIQYENEG